MISESLKRTVIRLVRSALLNECGELDKGADLFSAAKIAKEHQISAILYYGAAKCGIDKTSEFMQGLFPSVCAQLKLSENQIYESTKIFDSFKANNIDYLPLKGIIMKGIYPRPEMRHMGDVDILIRPKQYDIIEKLMLGMGYEFEYESDHELVWKNGVVTVELHKRIMTSYNVDLYKYFGEGWKFAKKSSKSCEYHFADEDFYIYLFAHFAKHYRISGIGIKHFLDIWVYRRANPNMDEVYIQHSLKKLGLDTFHKYVLNTLSVWFEDGNEDARTEKITDTIFESGEYGKKEITEISNFARNAGYGGKNDSERRRRVFSAAFPPLRSMKLKYSILEKLPFLLPVFWIVRLIYVLVFRADDAKAYKNYLNKITDEEVEERKRELEFVGLRFKDKG